MARLRHDAASSQSGGGHREVLLMTMRKIRSLLLGLGALSAVLVVGTQGALGAETLVEKGLRGSWTVVDTEAQPGASCTYDVDSDFDLDVIEARSPRVFARERTASRDSQRVGIRLIFQRSKLDGGSGGWETVFKTPMIKKLAHDDKAVGVGTRGWQAVYDGTPHFRALAAIRWYKPGTTSKVEGATTFRYQWYDTGSSTPEMDRCLPNP
jgi:hypothetical protein